MIKNSPENYALSWLVRRNTAVSNGWIKGRLQMGKATNFPELLKRIGTSNRGEWGFDLFSRIKNIQS